MSYALDKLVVAEGDSLSDFNGLQYNSVCVYMANKLEKRAKKLIAKFEKNKGMKKISMDHGQGYDMKSGNHPIEVKVRTKDYDIDDSAFVFLSDEQYNMLKNNKNGRVYIVYNMGRGKSPKLKRIHWSDDMQWEHVMRHRMRFTQKQWRKIKPHDLR